MVSDVKMMRVMADKYHRLAEQQSRPDERHKYRAYARIYSEMAIRFELHHELGGLGSALTANRARKQAGGVH
jgi:hypothetical protein